MCILGLFAFAILIFSLPAHVAPYYFWGFFIFWGLIFASKAIASLLYRLDAWLQSRKGRD
ncbi:TPA: hypothetical protein ACGO1T_000983 [Streptococcus suis]